MRVILLALVATLAAGPARAADGPPEARLLRFPDIHGDSVVFVYGSDIWQASAAGGPAHRLTSHAGLELTLRIYDPSGRWVVENEGVSPDVEVIDLPERRIAGGDPSLEKAVELLLKELEKKPGGRPPVPTPPRVVSPNP